MKQWFSSFLLILISMLIIPLACQDSKPDFRIIAEHRTVSIPVQMLSATSLETALAHPEALMLSAGGEDELPQGPQSFEVLDDAGLVIADPLQRRLVFYDSLGNYLDQWNIGFPVNSISHFNDEFFQVIKATSGDTLLVDNTGQVYAADARTRGTSPEKQLGETKLLGLNRGVIKRPKTRGGESGAIEIDFNSDSTKMIALQDLGMDSEGNSFVALETTHGRSGAIDIIKFIRQYSPDGRLLSQINDISLDYFVCPRDEFRVRDGFVYQLQPKQTELLVHVWKVK